MSGFIATNGVSAVDVATPTCRECVETKHGACDGTALVDTGDDIETHNCGCAEAGHPAASEKS